MFVVEHTIEDASDCDEDSRVTEDMIFELTVHTAANIIELIV